MNDPWNPNADEVRAWAFAPLDPLPEQDWHLALAWTNLDGLCLELAADDSCPKRRFFLGILYLMVGDAVGTDHQVTSRAEVEALLIPGSEPQHSDIVRWRERSLRLMGEPRQFDYDDWCRAGLAPDASN